MTTPNVPTRTPLGHDELRSRARKLSQRHRTILLLVDGRRPLAEVLSLALKAGSSTNHFEELVRLGLVELPLEAAAPDPVMTEPGALYVPRISSVAVDVAEQRAPPADEVDAPPAAAQAETVPEPVMVEPAAPAVVERAEPAVASVEVVDAPAERLEHVAQSQSAEPEPAEPLQALAQAAPTAPERPEAPAEPLLPPAAPYRPAALPAWRDVPVLAEAVEPERIGPLPTIDARAAGPMPAIAPARDEPARAEEPLVQQVHALLLETVRRHPPPFGSRIAGRLEHAQSMEDLRALVWEIEGYLSPRRAGGTLDGLYRARELLGLGNTVVADDGRDDWRDD